MELLEVEPGCARVKAEYIITTIIRIGNDADLHQQTHSSENGVEDPQQQQNHSKNDTDNNNTSARPTNNKKQRMRGMDRQREQKMARARAEARVHALRLCPSALEQGRRCKYGDRCESEHSREAYWAKKPADIGPRCVLFDQTGTCPYSVACCFARSHTNEDAELSQCSKEPDPSWPGPALNSMTMAVQQQLRKRAYDFSRADAIVSAFAAAAPVDQPPVGAEPPSSASVVVGCMEREPVKLDMRTLKGKKYLAPLTTVGNLPFRRMCVGLGAEVTCGEMAMATNILQCLPSELSLLKRHPCEKLFGVQLAGGYPDTLSKATQLIVDNFSVDFIDLNLGCPLDCVNERGGGCSLANKSNKLINVLRCMRHTAGATPVSVKMRYGMREGQRTAHLTIGTIGDKGAVPDLLTLHPRSKEQRYTKAAEWDYVPECVQKIGGRCPFFVCGDVLSYEDYYQRLEQYPEVDGIMIGRGALIKPWIFTEIEERRHWDISASERLELIKNFVNFGLEHWGSDSLGVENTRRFLLEWLSFQHRYIPVGLLERLPQRINQRPPLYRGRDELETLLASPASSDWVRISEMLLGKTPDGFLFIPKHKASAF